MIILRGTFSSELTFENFEQLLIATPGRCLDFLANSSLIGTPLSLDYVTCLVLDEADRMLEVGVRYGNKYIHI